MPPTIVNEPSFLTCTPSGRCSDSKQAHALGLHQQLDVALQHVALQQDALLADQRDAGRDLQWPIAPLRLLRVSVVVRPRLVQQMRNVRPVALQQVLRLAQHHARAGDAREAAQQPGLAHALKNAQRGETLLASLLRAIDEDYARAALLLLLYLPTTQLLAKKVAGLRVHFVDKRSSATNEEVPVFLEFARDFLCLVLGGSLLPSRFFGGCHGLIGGSLASTTPSRRPRSSPRASPAPPPALETASKPASKRAAAAAHTSAAPSSTHQRQQRTTKTKAICAIAMWGCCLSVCSPK